MAIPSGSGTEGLKRATTHNLNNTWSNIITGVANHIYTIISIVYCSSTASAGAIMIATHDGSNEIYHLIENVPANGTFVWNDKLVLEGDDILKVHNAVANGDWYVSYIDQDWT